MGSAFETQAGDAEGVVVSGGILTFTETLFLPAIVDASALPTEDPAVEGQVYVDSGVLTVSGG